MDQGVCGECGGVISTYKPKGFCQKCGEPMSIHRACDEGAICSNCAATAQEPVVTVSSE